MSPLFGSAHREREHLVTTLRALGPTTIAGLSSALSWTEHKTEKVLRTIADSRWGGIRYDPDRGTVGWASPRASTPTNGARAAPSSDFAAEPRAAAPLPQRPSASASAARWAGTAQCPTCHVELEPTGSADALYCPRCGRLRTGAMSARSDPGPADPSGPPSTPSSRSAGWPPVNDRRSQELFAAWVTSSPIPCPKCRTPLRHHGVSEYSCPACGLAVAFPKSEPLNGSGATATPVAPSPSS